MTLEAYRALESQASQGLVRNLGVSNIYDVGELEWLISQVREPVKVVQNRYVWAVRVMFMLIDGR